MSETAAYQEIDGIRCYAPDLAFENSDFPPEQFETLYKGEERNFWFRARNRILFRFLRKAGLGDKQGRFLEIGCGTGYVLNGIHHTFPKLELHGSEIYLGGLQFARKRLPDVGFIQLDATRMPFSGTYDGVGAFDVLEHIDADETVMQNIYGALKPGGHFFITVPQHPSLWSAIDDFSCHKRRYTREELTTKLEKAGFEVRYITSFVFTLLPMMRISRRSKKNIKVEDLTREQIIGELYLNPVLNFAFGIAMRFDELLISLGFSLPRGGSLLAVARKR